MLLTAMGPGSQMDSHKGPMSPFEINKLENKKAPEFSLKDINGREFTLSSLKGKVILLNFWATWCPPCKEEMPAFNRLYNDMKSHGLVVIAISTDKSMKEVKKYLSKNSFDFLIL